MALNALTLAVTGGVIGRPFLAAVNGLTTGRVEVLVDGASGFSFVNGTVFHPSLPYPVSTVVLREYEPGVGAGFRDSRIDIAAATNDALRAQALASLGGGRTLRNWRVASVRQPDGSFVYSLFVEDDLGATGSQAVGGGTPTPTPTPSSGLVTAVAVAGDLLDASSVVKPPLAVGDPVPLGTNGWVLRFELSSNVSIDPTKVVVNIDRPGWDNRVATTRRDTAIGTGLLRRAAPNHADALPAGTNAYYVTLDNQIYAPDAIASVEFLDGFYTSSGNLAFAGASVVRNDNLAYPQPLVRFAALPFQVASAATPTVELDVTGVSRFARAGRQFDAVEAWCRVGGVDGPVVATQTMQRSRHTPATGRLPGLPLPAYRLNPSAATLADGAGGVRVRVYPFCGPVWESWVSGTAFPTANVEAELPFINDQAGRYSPVYAWVNQDGSAATVVTASAITSTLDVTAHSGDPIIVGTVLRCGTATRTVTGFGTGTGTTGTYTVTPTGTVNSTTWSTGEVQTGTSDPGAAASFATLAAAARAITDYNAARSGGLAHADPDGGVIMLRDVAGSTLGAAAGSYSTRGAPVTGGTLVPLEFRAASGTTSQLCRVRGTLPDNSAITLSNKVVSGRMRMRNLTFDGTGVSAAADNIVFDGNMGAATTKASITTHLHLIDCDIREFATAGANHAVYRFGWRNDIRVDASPILSINSGGYTATYQCLPRTIGSAYRNATQTGSMLLPFAGGVRIQNTALTAQARITLADGGEVIDGYLFVNVRVDAAGGSAANIVIDPVPPLTVGVGAMNLFVRQGSFSSAQPGIRIGGDGTTAALPEVVLHYVATDGGFSTGTTANALNARWNMVYNDQTYSAPVKRLQRLGCASPSLNMKTDTFNAPEGPPNVTFTAGNRYYRDEIVHDGNATTADRNWYVYIGANNRVAVAGDLADTSLWRLIGKLFGTTQGTNPIRTGNWHSRHAVGDIGNVIANSADGNTNINVKTSFLQERLGRGGEIATDYSLYYKNPTGGGSFTVTDAGDYRPKSVASGDAVDSPLLGRIPSGMAAAPFDLEGNARLNNGSGAAGVYERV